ncbi:MAG: SAGA HAT/Core module component [Trizodia sp. TS-e1964]|nr:MAG: SAGA HAT/Core module component [Trizodia sp. TS-e1964]
MSMARARPSRGPLKDEGSDVQEETLIWNQIVTGIKSLKGLNLKSGDISKQIVEAEERLGNESTPTVSKIEALQMLYREGLRLAEDEQRIINEELISNVTVLIALRNASENEPTPRASTLPKVSRNFKRKLEREDNAESPGPSPNMPSTTTRLAKGASVRSASVPFIFKDTKEASVKVEDSAIGSVAEVSKADSLSPLQIKSEVAYKQSKGKGIDGDWIQCTIISVIGEGQKKRYSVQDPEPEENGQPVQIYKATASQLIPIPPASAALADYPKGKSVLARYPETTTFYRAEVMGMKGNICRLKFEGEDELNKETDVPRRYVLDIGNRQPLASGHSKTS